MTISEPIRPMYGYYIGRALDEKIRIKSTSGGLGTAITKYLLSSLGFDTALTFKFDKVKCKYVPYFIHNPEDINICGSVYQDIDIPSFLRSHVHEIKKGVIVSAPPCQVPLVKKILKGTGFKSFVISFNCSGQTTIEGTWEYYKLLGIKKSQVVSLQYRGNGWPSGIQIELKDGTRIYKENWTSPWTVIQNSKLYTPKRCLLCRLDASYVADISLGDPWLEEFVMSDKKGHTLLVINTDFGRQVIEEMAKHGQIHISQSNRSQYMLAQKDNVEKGFRVNNKRTTIILKMRNNKLYFYIASINLFTLSLHIRLLKLINHFWD